MPQCHKCGREIPRKTGVFKVVKTGKFTAGSDYYRSVNLCPKCAETIDAEETGQKKKQLLLVLVGVLAVAGLVYWFMFMRPQ